MCDYENRLVFFIDILGFKEKVAESNKNISSLDKIVKVLQIFNDFKQFNMDLKEFKDIEFSMEGIFDATREITHFSDSIVISFNLKNTTTIQFIIEYLLNIIVKALTYDMVFRGGVAMGKLIHSEDHVFGPAFIEAYQLECEAKNPRIIFSNEIAQTYSLCKYGGVKQDTDGYYYLDYFNIQDFDFHGGSPSEDIMRHLNCLDKIIEKGLSNTDDDIVKKYLWMKSKYNWAITNIEKWLLSQKDDFSDIIKKVENIKNNSKVLKCTRKG